MNPSAWFIHRPVGTALLAVAMTLVGAICYFLLPVSPLPQVEYPTINIGAGLPGASPETMASAVATPLERQFGLIAGRRASRFSSISIAISMPPPAMFRPRSTPPAAGCRRIFPATPPPVRSIRPMRRC